MWSPFLYSEKQTSVSTCSFCISQLFICHLPIYTLFHINKRLTRKDRVLVCNRNNCQSVTSQQTRYLFMKAIKTWNSFKAVILLNIVTLLSLIYVPLLSSSYIINMMISATLTSQAQNPTWVYIIFGFFLVLGG